MREALIQDAQHDVVTTMAISSTRPSPRSESGNACAAPWNCSETASGTVDAARLRGRHRRARSRTRLNEIITDGSWPKWFTWSGPTAVFIRATDSSGMSRPVLDRRRAATSRPDRSETRAPRAE